MSFATTTELMPHQVQAVGKLLPSKVGALFMEMGTGKSLTLIKLAEIRQGKWDRFFWFCPVSLKDTVLHQLLEHTTLQAADIKVWGDKVSTGNMPTAKRVHIVGIESLSASDRVYLAFRAMVTASSFVAVDESSYIKGHNSKRTARITAASDGCRYRAVLTGTPFTQGAVDLYAQMRFLSPRILGYRSFYSFASNHLEYKERTNDNGRRVKTNQIVRAHDVDILAAKIAPYTYQVRKDECLTLPDKLHETRWCGMTVEQRELYNAVKHRILTELEYDDWSQVKIFHLFTALQTVLCGWYTDAKDGVTEVAHSRVDTLIAAVAEIPAGERVIVWAKYRRAVEQITTALAAEYGPESVHQFFGDQSESERAEALAASCEASR